MLTFRNIEKSVHAKVSGLLTSPTSDLSATPYRVYGETDYFNADLVGTFPFIFIMGYRVPPRETRLPLIIIEVDGKSKSYLEIGSRSGIFVSCALHVFGRNRGERDDLAAYLFQSLDWMNLYDYSTNPATLLYPVSLEAMWSGHGSVREDVGLEGTLANWESLQFSFQLK